MSKNCNCNYKTFGTLIPSLHEGIFPECLPPKNMIYIYKRKNGKFYYYDHFGVERAFEGFTLENLNLKVQGTTLTTYDGSETLDFDVTRDDLEVYSIDEVNNLLDNFANDVSSVVNTLGQGIKINNTNNTTVSFSSNQTRTINLNTNHTWVVDTEASYVGATVGDIINGQYLKEIGSDKRVNNIRVTAEVGYTGGTISLLISLLGELLTRNDDGVLRMTLVSAGTGARVTAPTVPINFDGAGQTTPADETFYIRTIKTTSNLTGYSIEVKNGNKAITSFRIKSILIN